MLRSVRHSWSLLSLLLLLATLAGLLPHSVAARQWVTDDTPPEPPPKTMDELLARFEQPDAPGAAVAVLVDGALAYTGAFGKADLAHDVAVTPETVFNVASLAKQFTAFAIALLADQGKLSLDDDIRTYLPEVPDFGETITIRHLIYHTSGLRDELGMLVLAGWRYEDLITNDDVLGMVSRQKNLDYTPGDRHLYSNTNYTLLAAIVARVGGLPFPAWTQTHLFEPLGMTHTRFVDTPDALLAHRAMNYDQTEDGTLVRKPDTWYNVGPGSLYTTVTDLAKWARNLQTGRVGGEAVLRQIREAGTLNDGEQIDYAFGLGHGEDRGLRTLGHGGSAPGTQSSLRLYPDQNVAIMVLSNAGGRVFSLHELTQQTAAFYLGDQMQQPGMNPGDRRVVVITEEDLKATPQGPYPANPDRYDAYEGTYELELEEGQQDDLFLGQLLLVSRDGDRLLLAFGEPPGFPLAPVAEDHFILPQLNFEITFHVGATDTAESLTFHITEQSFGDDPPQDLRGIKHQKQNLTPDQLEAYAGTYYSAELETIYRIVVRDGQLVITHQRHGAIPLAPLAPDEFLADTHLFTNVSFIRDDRGHVAQVRLKGYSWSSSAVLDRIILP